MVKVSYGGAACLLLFLAGLGCSPGSAPASSSQRPSNLGALVAAAAAEGELDTAITTEAGAAVPKLTEAFNKRFGLELKLNVAQGDQAGKFAKLIATLDAGARPEFDSLTGSEEDLIQSKAKGYIVPIEGWEV